jgi:hypothetical protein
MNARGSIGGVTVGNAWMFNNPDLDYPDGHETMSDETLSAALKTEPSSEESALLLRHQIEASGRK